MKDAAKHDLTPRVKATFETLFGPLARYHQHSVVGMENIPASGGVLLAFSHSFATYDGFLTGYEIYKSTGRVPIALGDNLIFKTPILRQMAWDLGIRPGNHENGKAILQDGGMLLLAPGGMKESLRPQEQRYRVEWERRRGFVKLALRSQVPIVLVACGAADDLYTVKQSRLTSFAYERFRVPLPVIFGRAGSLFPKKIVLKAFVSEPFYPPVHDPENEASQVQAMHGPILEKMQELMQLR